MRRAAPGLGDRAGHTQEILLGVTVDVAVVRGVADDHPKARAALQAALGPLDATVVEGDAEALPCLDV